MEIIQQYLIEEALILIPVLYVIGMFFKSIEIIKDKYIPMIIWVFGVALSMSMLGLNVQGFIQGTLVAGVSVFASQVYIQTFKKDK